VDASFATKNVVDFVLSTRLADIPDTVREKASRHIADTIGCMLAGTRSDLASNLLEYIRSRQVDGASAVLGWTESCDPETAALANATLGHALDYDDANTAMRGHPSAIVVGAILASPDAVGLSGERFLEAYILGVEAATRISKAMEVGPQLHLGWHFTGTMGILAATLALARVVQLSELEARRALGTAASMASGLQRNFGTMTKPLHAGLAAQRALSAVNLARNGWTANEDILDGEEAFAAVYGGPDAHPWTIGKTLGSPFIFDESPFGIHLKLYPCCYASHRIIEAALAIGGAKPVDPDTVEFVRARVLPNGLRPLLYKRPKTGLEAKFSMEYAIATALLDGAVGFSSFTDAAASRLAAHRLMERMDIAEDKDCNVGEDGKLLPDSFGFTSRGFVELTVGFRDRGAKTERVYYAKGSAQRPLGWSEVGSKFLDCAAHAGVAAEVASNALQRLQHLSQVEDVTTLARTLVVRMH
jgi:2-methylcitrate dehydratase PrpD